MLICWVSHTCFCFDFLSASSFSTTVCILGFYQGNIFVIITLLLFPQFSLAPKLLDGNICPGDQLSHNTYIKMDKQDQKVRVELKLVVVVL